MDDKIKDKIDIETDSQISFPKKHGLYKEMQAWIVAGYEVEERETPELGPLESARFRLHSDRTTIRQGRHHAAG